MLGTLRLLLGLLCCEIIATIASSSVGNHGRYRSCAARFVCVSLARCPHSADQLHRASDVTSAVNLLHQHLCGLRGESMEVCCHQAFAHQRTGGALVEDASVERDDDVIVRQANDTIEDHPGLKLINQHCGSSIKNRILGGAGTIPGEFPWLALLQYQLSDDQLEFLCGGSLISNRYILTAAHCIPSTADPFKTLVSVRLGEHDLRTDQDCALNGHADEEGVIVCAANPPRDYEIARVIPHPGFQETEVFRHDIALIKLRQRVLLDPPFVVPVCLPVGDLGPDESLEESRLEVAGWGVTEAGLWTSDVLLKVAVKYVSPADCERSISYRLQPGHLCAGGVGGEGPCTGDSGGPLMQMVGGGERRRARICYQVGVVSVALDNCASDAPAVYTRVRSYLPWILDNIDE